jgi:hypothetical protein
MKKYDSNLMTGLILILIGGGLLLKRAGLLDFGWEETYPVALLLLAAMSIVSVAKGEKNHAFWASFLLICGLFSFFKNYGVIDSLWSVNFWSILLLAFGLSFFALYALKPQDWGVLVPGSILTAFGMVAILDDLNISWFNLRHIIDYWPLILIVIGAGIIFSSLKRKPIV